MLLYKKIVAHDFRYDLRIYVTTSVTKFGAILFTPIMHTGEFASLWTLEAQGFLV